MIFGGCEQSRFDFDIPGAPIGKGRPRASMRGGRPRLYTPSRTAEWEGRASVVLRDSWGQRAPLEGPVRLHVLALFPRPKRMIWKRKKMPREPYTGKPDASNVLKAVEDAIEKAGIYRDDKQIWSSSIVCLYCSGEESPLVRLRLRW
jgi:Holliday junction resolvase RusA-like endonuclease